MGKFPKTIPLCGLPFQVDPRVSLVETGLIANQAVWGHAYVARGCKTPRDKRRMHIALAHAFKELRVTDRSVVLLLGDLAVNAIDSPIRDAVLALVAEFDCVCDVSLSADTPAWECLRRILDIKVDPRCYSIEEIDKYMSDVQLVKFLSKYPFKGAETRAEEVAIQKLVNQESINALTNKRWHHGDFDSEALELISEVSHQLERILGPAPTPEDVLKEAAWGPGTIVGHSYGVENTGPEFKFAQKVTLTPNLTSVAPWVVTNYPEWSASMLAMNQHNWFSVVPGDVLFTVPKKFEEHRCAMKQPALNIWLTRGVGVVIRKRLCSRAGLDLLHQQWHNRKLAQIGSATGLYCTLDLTSASDSVCRSVLRSVLSPAWFAWLYSTASKRFRLPAANVRQIGKPVSSFRNYEMMSSMGCGFTFELQTALFLAICRSIVPGQWIHSSRSTGGCELRYPHIGVNGDDIIVPNAYAHRVMDALRLFGLTVNVNKSHFDEGPGFRESCGGDFLFGVAVRPFFLHSRLDDGSAIARAANNLVCKALEFSETIYGDNRFGIHWFRAVHSRLVGFVPPFIRNLITTPPGVPSGIWSAGCSVSPDTLTGQPLKYMVLSPKQEVINLADAVVWDSFPGAWPQSLNGANLFAARLSTLGSDPAERAKWDSVSHIGTGEVATCRGVSRIQLGYESASGYEQWRGWRMPPR